MVVVCWLLTLYFVALLLRAILSWFPLTRRDGVMATIIGGLMMITDPLIRPVRRMLRPMRVGAVALDFSPTIVMVGVLVLRRFVC